MKNSKNLLFLLCIASISISYGMNKETSSLLNGITIINNKIPYQDLLGSFAKNELTFDDETFKINFYTQALQEATKENVKMVTTEPIFFNKSELIFYVDDYLGKTTNISLISSIGEEILKLKKDGIIINPNDESPAYNFVNLKAISKKIDQHVKEQIEIDRKKEKNKSKHQKQPHIETPKTTPQNEPLSFWQHYPARTFSCIFGLGFLAGGFALKIYNSW